MRMLTREEVRGRCERGAAVAVQAFDDTAVGVPYPDTFSHLVRNWLPRAWACMSQLGACGRLYVPTKMQPLYKEMVADFFPDLVSVDVPKDHRLFCPASLTTPEYYMLFRSHGRMPDSPTCRSADVVFTTRAAASGRFVIPKSGASRRSLGNPSDAWRAVMQAAEKSGLTAEFVEFEKMSFADQRRKMCTTRLLVAQHGAAMGHILWSGAPRRAVLELPPALHGWWEQVLVPNRIALFRSTPTNTIRKQRMWTSISFGRHRVNAADKATDRRRRSGRVLTVDEEQLRGEVERAIQVVAPRRRPEDDRLRLETLRAADGARSRALIDKSWAYPKLRNGSGGVGVALAYDTSLRTPNAWLMSDGRPSNQLFLRPLVLNWYRGGGLRFNAPFRSGAIVCEAAAADKPCAMVKGTCIEGCLGTKKRHLLERCQRSDEFCRGGCAVIGCWSSPMSCAPFSEVWQLCTQNSATGRAAENYTYVGVTAAMRQ